MFSFIRKLLLCSLNGKDAKGLLARTGYGNDVALSRADQGDADGGGVGDLTGSGVGFVGADDVVGRLHTARFVIYGDDGADADAGLIHLTLVKDARVCDHLAKLGDAGVDLALLGLCLIVLAVLGQVAEGTGGGDLLFVLLHLDGDEVVELLLECLEALGRIDLEFCHDCVLLYDCLFYF